jgi:hypothetical protein
MSLKHFHIFFIAASIVLTAGFGLWCFLTEDGTGLAGSKWMGSVSLIATVALVVYVLRIPAKLRG